jgi:putative transposase
MWSPKGQQVMIPTPAQPKKWYGLGAVNYHTGETVVHIRRRKRRQETAELLQALLDRHATGTVYVTWDNASTHHDDEVEAVVRGAAGRLVLLYLPTYSPWLNPIEMLWRHMRREVTHCELFETIANCLKRWRRWSRQRMNSLRAITKCRTGCCRSSGCVQHNTCGCTY